MDFLLQLVCIVLFVSIVAASNRISRLERKLQCLLKLLEPDHENLEFELAEALERTEEAEK